MILRFVMGIILAGTVTSVLGGCDSLGPEDVTASGSWAVRFGPAESEFVFDLEEDADGQISGSWSNPSQFFQNPVAGRRNGLEVTVTGVSPNIFVARLDVVFVRKRKLEGFLEFGNALHEVTLVPSVRPR